MKEINCFWVTNIYMLLKWNRFFESAKNKLYTHKTNDPLNCKKQYATYFLRLKN